MGVVKVTRKRQITLPKEVCDKLEIAPGDYVRVYIDKDSRVVVEKVLGINELAGYLNPGRPLKNLAEELDKERKLGER